VNILFFHHLQNGFAGRSLKTPGLHQLFIGPSTWCGFGVFYLRICRGY